MNHLEKHEVLAVLKIAREQSELDWLLFTFQYIHSHRISEVLTLTPENFDGGFCTVQRLKGSLKTTQPLVTHEEPLLNERPAIDALLRRPRAGTCEATASELQRNHAQQTVYRQTVRPGGQRSPLPVTPVRRQS